MATIIWVPYGDINQRDVLIIKKGATPPQGINQVASNHPGNRSFVDLFVGPFGPAYAVAEDGGGVGPYNSITKHEIKTIIISKAQEAGIRFLLVKKDPERPDHCLHLNERFRGHRREIFVKVGSAIKPPVNNLGDIDDNDARVTFSRQILAALRDENVDNMDLSSEQFADGDPIPDEFDFDEIRSWKDLDDEAKKLLESFPEQYESAEYRAHFNALTTLSNCGYEGNSSSDWAKDWAVARSMELAPAVDLDNSRRACLKLLFRMYDECKGKLELETHLPEYFKAQWVSNILQVAMEMDRANSLYNMQVVRGMGKPRGIHWMSKKDMESPRFQAILEGYEGYISQNKSYEWIFEIFGLSTKSFLVELVKPVFFRHHIRNKSALAALKQDGDGFELRDIQEEYI